MNINSESGSSPWVTVVINNYNYAEYVEEAIDSVLNQNYSNIQVIVVDDGSTDDSIEKIGVYKDLVLILKENGGQLSCFNAALKEIKGEICFFLDSDDNFTEKYIETVVETYLQNEDVDFIFVPVKTFGDGESRMASEYWHEDIVIGCTQFLVAATGEWIGSPTSAISMKRTVLERMLPYELEDDWKIAADRLLVVGASIAGARKMFVNRTYVNYRVHGNNAWHGRAFEAYEYFKYKTGEWRMIDNIRENNRLKMPYFYEHVGLEMWDGAKPKKLGKKYFHVPQVIEHRRVEVFLRVLKTYIRLYVTRKRRD